MAKLIKNKGVSFNILDDFQNELYEFSCQKTNFSSYVKRLIQRDMEHGFCHTKQKVEPLLQEQESDIKIDLDSFFGG